MNIFKRYFQNIKNIPLNELLFSILLPITLFLIVVINYVFRASNLYGVEILHFDTAFKNQIILISIFYFISAINNFKKILFNFNSTKIIYFIFLTIIYKIYLYRIPFDFGTFKLK